MSETIPTPNVSEKQKQPEAGSGPVLDWGVGTLFNAQADLLAGAEATVTDWLRRRHEAVVDTGQLISRMRLGGDVTDAFKAQREWVARSFQRLAAETEAYQSATQQLMDRAPSWFPQGGWAWFPRIAGSTETASSQAAATRAAGKPLRMANKSE